MILVKLLWLSPLYVEDLGHMVEKTVGYTKSTGISAEVSEYWIDMVQNTTMQKLQHCERE